MDQFKISMLTFEELEKTVQDSFYGPIFLSNEFESDNENYLRNEFCNYVFHHFSNYFSLSDVITAMMGRKC